MVTLVVVIVIAVVMVILSLSMALLESNSGYLGDHSMVPGILLVGIVVGVIAAIIGFDTGNWSMTFN